MDIKLEEVAIYFLCKYRKIYLLTTTSNPIHSFADDSTLDSSYSFTTVAEANQPSVQQARTNVSNSLNRDLKEICDWGSVNRVNFNASKTQCCLLSVKLNPSIPSLFFENVNIENSESINILGMEITSKLSWNNHIFSIAKNAAKCLGFLWRSKKYFTSSDLLIIYKTYIRPRLEYNSHIWAGAPQTCLQYLDRVQKWAIKIINDANISKDLTSLSHRRNVGALSLFYRYLLGDCSTEIRDIMPKFKTFARFSRKAAQAHKFTLEPNFHRTLKFRSSFIARTTTIWNKLPSHVFPGVYNLDEFKRNVNRFLLP